MYQSLRGVAIGLALIVLAGAGALALPRRAAPAAVSAVQAGPSARRPDQRGPASFSPTPFWGQGELAFLTDGQITVLHAPHDRSRIIGFPGLLPANRCGTNPAWSADGRWLAFVRDDCPDPDHSVAAAGSLTLEQADRYGLRVIHPWPGAVLGADFAWSPAGDRLAVAPTSGGIWIVHVHPQSAVGQPLVRGGSVAGSPLWSPDGRQIAFTKGDGVYTVPARGGRLQRRYLARSAGVRLAGWWPDGRGLVLWIDPQHSASPARVDPGLRLEKAGRLASS